VSLDGRERSARGRSDPPREAPEREPAGGVCSWREARPQQIQARGAKIRFVALTQRQWRWQAQLG
jgi:hypothetical protein